MPVTLRDFPFEPYDAQATYADVTGCYAVWPAEGRDGRTVAVRFKLTLLQDQFGLKGASGDAIRACLFHNRAELQRLANAASDRATA